MPSSLDLFQRPLVQTSILKTEEIGYKPLTSLENLSTIEFLVAGLSDTYIDLSSATIRLKLQILDKKGEAQVNIDSPLPNQSQTNEMLDSEIPENMLKSETSLRKRSAEVKYNQ